MQENKPSVSVSKWFDTIAAYDREFSEWEKRSEKILKRYRDERTGSSKRARFNILWSNIQTIMPAVFARLPKPDVSRRFADSDPVGRVASLILERALTYEIENHEDYRHSLKQAIQDRFLGGRGTAWVRYEPHTKQVDDGVQITEDAEAESPAEVLDYECAPVDFVHAKDFGHTVARTWEEVTAVWRKVYMSGEALTERFGEEIAAKVPKDQKPDEVKAKSLQNTEGQACVYEIWDKSTKTAIWLAKGVATALDIKSDPLGLEGFWPCPKPLFGTLTNESLVPVPDFALYQDQANQLDILAERVEGLVKALKVRGVYDSTFPELGRLLTEGDNNTLIPVKNFTAFAEKQGLKGSFDLIDLTPIAQTLEYCYKAAEQIKAQVYEITGISDILRGATEADETATAQQMKGNYASVRLRNMQDEIAYFAAELIRIKAQIICSYEPQSILQISAADQLRDEDKPLIPQALALLKNKVVRNFRIDIESDSMVRLDEQQEKQNRVEFLNAAGGFIKQSVEAVNSAPDIAQLVLEMLKFGVTGFKVGRQLEGLFDETVQQVKQSMAERQKNPPPNPEMMKVQAQAQLDQQKNQGALQLKAQELQLQDQANERQAQRDVMVEREKQQAQAQQIAQQNRIEAETDAQRLAQEGQLEQMRMQFEQRQAETDAQIKWLIAQLQSKTQIEVAEMSNETTLEAAQMSAAKQGASE